MKNKNWDIIIIGAGAAGLMAAWELCMTGRKTLILEARNRIGGRIESVQKSNMVLEMGAEFVHGDLKLTNDLLKKSGASTIKVKGSIWQVKKEKLQQQKEFIEDYSELDKKFEQVQADMSVAEFFEMHLNDPQYEEARFTIRNYVEGYYAGNIEEASVFALREELRESSDKQFRIDKGYGHMIRFLEAQCLNAGAEIVLNQAVNSIEWKRNQVLVSSSNHSYSANKTLITVPIGVLATDQISFSPTLPKHKLLLSRLGFGGVVKTILHFRESFWEAIDTGTSKMNDLGFLFSEESIPTWWSHYPQKDGILTGWSGGPNAARLAALNDEEIVDEALRSLSAIFALDTRFLQSILDSAHVANWIQDPYSLGGYSFDVVNGNEMKKQILEPVSSTLYFAGEGLHEGPEIGTVEGALYSGREMARRMIAD